jgi:hypothetical protein
MNAVHIAVGSAVLALSAITGLWGAWRWSRWEPSPFFWRLLRTTQIVLVLEAALGGILLIEGKKPGSLHVLYGLLPLAVSFIAEQLRISSAEMVLDARGFESSADVGQLPEEDQQDIVAAILRRELGVMTLAALVMFGLAVRAAMTGA